MAREKRREEEFQAIIDRFSLFIRMHIQKFNLQRYGLDTEDIFQEVRIKIWKVLNDEKKINNYSSYIKKIVDSSVIDHLRKMKREERIFRQEKQKKVAEQKKVYVPEFSHEKIIKEMIGKAVDSLIESRRKVVKLYLLSMTIEEISAYLNWSKDKTRNLLYRGLSDLKEILKKGNQEWK